MNPWLPEAPVGPITPVEPGAPVEPATPVPPGSCYTIYADGSRDTNSSCATLGDQFHLQSPVEPVIPWFPVEACRLLAFLCHQ